MKPLGIGVVGCGYVAGFYCACIEAFPTRLAIVGVFDLDRTRAEHLAALYGYRCFDNLNALLGELDVDVILNLTPPEGHFDVARQTIDAGKHIICEKPLAESVPEAFALFAAAEAAHVAIGCAPFVDRSLTARRLWRRLRDARSGPISHLYVDLDDGPVHRMDCDRWITRHGVPWPLKSEFELGPIVHHAPYALAWAISIAGPVRRMSGAVVRSVQTKRGYVSGPDLAICTLEHRTGAVSRLTIGALAARNRRLTVVCANDQFDITDMFCCDAAVKDSSGNRWGKRLRWPYNDTHRLNFHAGLLHLQALLERFPETGAASFREHHRAIAVPIVAMTSALRQPGSINLTLDAD